ncbi:hypothetical protein B0J15DRAFT_598431 [Fusarium solani]|uniref:Uncharacterized protein n=1 Tax=Fusarium solani TaxID=169388 RepID=A0A9P9GHB5_FUSSL|nr:uncharacterized protein B0J15DRAFT_598431 [Fusarium solani]KAH7237952.1 hypothetical protein B0J15DRAFT_598431 [Fusarium solani]
MERPKLDKEKAKIRLRWASAWLPEVEELMEMINSDEVSIQNKSCNPQAYAFRHAYEKYNKEVVNKGDHVKPTISQIKQEERIYVLER